MSQGLGMATEGSAPGGRPDARMPPNRQPAREAVVWVTTSLASMVALAAVGMALTGGLTVPDVDAMGVGQAFLRCLLAVAVVGACLPCERALVRLRWGTVPALSGRTYAVLSAVVAGASVALAACVLLPSLLAMLADLSHVTP